MTAALLLMAQPVVSLQQLSSLLAAHGLSPANTVEVATSSGALGPLSAGAYDVVLSVADQPGHHNVQLLGLLTSVLKPGGKLVVQEPGTSKEALSKALLLSGLRADGAAPEGGVAAHKPAWQVGAKASIALKPRQSAAVAEGAPAAAAGTWKLALGGDDDEELVDDEALLTKEDKQRPSPSQGNDDCEVGTAGRKACKNCTCGRAEGGDVPPVKLTQELLDNPTSGCGSCGLGDAFRCGGCPYRGLPSFEMGKKIELPSDFLAMDV